MLKSKRKSSHAGLLGQLKLPLLRYVFKQHKHGMTVNTFLLIVNASPLSPEFNANHFTTRCSAMKQFDKAHSLIYRMGTHKMQCKPEDITTEA